MTIPADILKWMGTSHKVSPGQLMAAEGGRISPVCTHKSTTKRIQPIVFIYMCNKLENEVMKSRRKEDRGGGGEERASVEMMQT